jgi:DNA repair protein SbcD/Mre11
MDFSFIHTADLHLGSPFVGLSSSDLELARRVAAASREALEDLFTRAIELDVDFVVIAGDVYDGDWKDTTIGHFFNRETARLEREGIPVYLIRGNHDAESVITSAVTLPESVHVFSARTAETLRIPELKVALHGRSFANRAVPENLAISYPPPEAGWFNIGVLHTSCDGRPPHANYAPCRVQDLIQRGYQYWALGHVHTYEQLNEQPRIVFPGNLQGRNIRECGAKGAILVSVEDGEIVESSRLLVGRIRWASISADLTGASSESEAFEIIREAVGQEVDAAEGTPVIFRMTLTGVTTLHRSLHSSPERVADEVLSAANHCSDLIWLESVRLETSESIALAAGDDSSLSSLDLGSMLGPLLVSPEVRTEARAALDLIKGKFPSMDLPDDLFGDDKLVVLLDEAREALLGSQMSVEG